MCSGAEVSDSCHCGATGGCCSSCGLAGCWKNTYHHTSKCKYILILKLWVVVVQYVGWKAVSRINYIILITKFTSLTIFNLI